VPDLVLDIDLLGARRLRTSLTLAPSRRTLAPSRQTLAPSRQTRALSRTRALTLAPSRLARTLAPSRQALAPSRLAWLSVSSRPWLPAQSARQARPVWLRARAAARLSGSRTRAAASEGG
jgi:hypothetical protein